jgi:hypothetical protein
MTLSTIALLLIALDKPRTRIRADFSPAVYPSYQK